MIASTEGGPAAAADHETIRQCLARAARGLDRRDRSLLESVFWPDAEVNVSYRGSAPDFINWVLPLLESIELTQHFLGQSLIEIAGSSAAVETHFQAYHRITIAGVLRDIVLSGRYVDRFELRDGEWRIAFRLMIADSYRDELSPAGGWTSFAMGPLPPVNLGTADDTDPSIALLAGRWTDGE